jgi:Holliday junction resolvasome RuvABC endonuclease subunit
MGDYFREGTIAFDLGKSCTGWAIMNGSKLLGYGRRSFENLDTPELYDAMVSLLDGVHASAFNQTGHKPLVAAMEAAEHQRGSAQEAYAPLYVALRVWARAHLMGVAKVYSGTIKKVVTGSGRAPKEEVVAAINQTYGLTLSVAKKSADHNVADAIGAGLTAWTLDQLDQLVLI